MMNKIEEIKGRLRDKHCLIDKISEKDAILHLYDQVGFNKGFKAAMDLQLPVKFHQWASRPIGSFSENLIIEMHTKIKDTSDESLYDYWLNNIYTPEP